MTIWGCNGLHASKGIELVSLVGILTESIFPHVFSCRVQVLGSLDSLERTTRQDLSSGIYDDE